MEPWDGPASIAFTDGRQIGATLDRNGLRPSRYMVTDDDLVIMGVRVRLPADPEEQIIKKWRLQPGKMFLVDLEQGRIIDDQELKDISLTPNPTRSGSSAFASSSTTRCRAVAAAAIRSALLDRQQAFGYTQET